MSRSILRLCWMIGLTGLWAGVLSAADEPVRPIRVGVLTDNYPFSFVEKDGRIDGFAYELVNEIEQVMGLKFERVTGPTNEINPAFASGQLDLLQSYVQFPEREAYADFSVPYLSMTGAIFAREGETRIHSFADLKGRRVLLHKGSLGESILRRAGLADSIVYTESVEQSIIRLDRGEGDAVLISRLNGQLLAHRLGLQHVHPLPVAVEDYDVRYCIAVRKSNPALLAKVNEGLAILVRTGRFDALYQKWFGHAEPKGYTKEQVIGAVAAGLALALAVAVWAAAKQRMLRRQIARQAEALRVSEERHRAVFEGARDGLVVLGRGPEDFVLEQVNPAAAQLLPGAAPGGRLGELLAADPPLAARLRSSAAAGRTEEFEHEQADRRRLRVVVSPLGGRVLITVADITEQVRARERLRQQEEQLRQKQKLEAVGTLAGGVAHDFNNLLTSILGNLELALLGLPADHAEADGLKQALLAARRARDLVRQILAFSRQTAPSREVLAIRPLVEETINLLRTLAKNAVEFEVRITPDLPAVLADPVQVHQVLMNIGTNAVQAMQGAPGRLVFHAAVIEVGPEADRPAPELQPGSHVRISIQDTGPGMTPEVQLRSFEPFFTTKPPGEGTGLGLSVVHGIMQQHGGAVTIYSQPGRGTLFHLYFRAASMPARAEPEAVADIPLGRGERILFVDDDPAIVATAQKMLRQLNYVVSAHARAEDAFAEWKAAPAAFAVIISDLTMPGMNGLQLLARVHALRPGQLFILTSGFFSETETAEAKALGAAELLAKPLTRALLGRAVAARLGRE